MWGIEGEVVIGKLECGRQREGKVAIFDAAPCPPKRSSLGSKLPLWVQLLAVLSLAIGVFVASLFWGAHYLETGFVIWGLGLFAAIVVAIVGWAIVMHFDEVRRREH
jgi:hypothetical protein